MSSSIQSFKQPIQSQESQPPWRPIVQLTPKHTRHQVTGQRRIITNPRCFSEKTQTLNPSKTHVPCRITHHVPVSSRHSHRFPTNKSKKKKVYVGSTLKKSIFLNGLNACFVTRRGGTKCPARSVDVCFGVFHLNTERL